MKRRAKPAPDTQGSDPYISRIRRAAGWYHTSAGWLSHDNIPEQQWREQGFPLPEDPYYGQWYRAHYDVLVGPFLGVQTV